MNLTVYSEPKMGFIFRQNRKSDHFRICNRSECQAECLGKKASAEGNADVLEGFQEESGNEIDDDDSSDKEIPFSLGGTEEHGEVPGWVHFFIGRPTHSPDHHDYGHSNGQSKPSHYFSLMISVQNA